MLARKARTQLPRPFISRPILSLSILVATLAAITKFWPRLSLFTRHLSTTQRPLFKTVKMSLYSKELEVAELAVQRAAILTKAVFHEKAKGTLSKDDKSPVTIGDFGAQALIINAIKQNFPEDEIVGEEEASDLRENVKLRDQIWALVDGTKLSDAEAEKVLGGPI